MSAFWHLVHRDLLLAWKEGGTIGVALGFYLIVVTMLPLSLGPDLNLLARIAPGLLWVALLLAALLSLGRLFETDLEDGSLEVLATGPLPLEAVAAAKSLGHWLTTCWAMSTTKAEKCWAGRLARSGLNSRRRRWCCGPSDTKSECSPIRYL